MTGAIPSKPLVVFDGDCGFCRRCVLWLQARTAERVDCAPWQQAAADHPHIAPEQFAAAVHLIEPDGRVFRGASAVGRALRHAPGWRWVWPLLRLVPGAGALAEGAYRFVAAHRVGVSRLARGLSGRSLEPPSFQCARRLFFGLLGVVFLAAFVSCWAQVEGLIGSRGLLPVAELLDRARSTLGVSAFWQVPTLCWLSDSDLWLRGQCAAGALGAVALALGFAPRALLVVLWALYLSLVTAGQDFFAFQWDGLLLETALCALFLAPPGLRPRWRVEPSSGALFLLRWLLLRLMLLSGLVKLLSGDPAWRDLSALGYHQWTQPLPLWIAHAAASLPDGVHRASAVAMFAIELALPLLVLAPRRLRLLAAAGFLALQAGIAATGNYGFFNLLTAALCMLLIDDRTLRAFVPLFARDRLLPLRAAIFVPGSPLRRALALPLGCLLFSLSTFAALDALIERPLLPESLRPFWRQIQTLRSTNSYGLFAVMTTERPELILEGSDDRREWQPYEFRWKPGRLDRAPRTAGLHMPRLDWQMWFEALRARAGVPPSHWFVRLQQRLLEGEPAVLALLERDPFAGDRPAWLRVRTFAYRFTEPWECRAQGQWWERRLLATGTPVGLRDR